MREVFSRSHDMKYWNIPRTVEKGVLFIICWCWKISLESKSASDIFAPDEIGENISQLKNYGRFFNKLNFLSFASIVLRNVVKGFVVGNIFRMWKIAAH